MELVESRVLRPYARWVISHRLFVALVILGITEFSNSRNARYSARSSATGSVSAARRAGK